MGATVTGLVVLIATGIALKDWIREEYWIRRLRYCDFEPDRVGAATKLGKLRSVRAVPEIVRTYDRLPPLRGAGYTSPREIQAALMEIGEPALPALVSAMAADFGHSRWMAAEAISLILKENYPRTAAVVGQLADTPGDSIQKILKALCVDQEVTKCVRVAAAEALEMIQEKTQ